MTIEDLTEFKTLASCLNFTYAAKLLYISQSTLSKHIMRMEKELHKDLFVRTKTGISLTVEGQQFLPYVNKILKTYEMTIKELKVRTNPLSGSISIVVSAKEEDAFSPALIAVMEKKFPDIQIHLSFVSTDPWQAVLQEQADLAEIYLDQIPENLELQKAEAERNGFCLLVPKGHPFGNEQQIEADRLSGQSLIFLRSQADDHDFVRDYLAKNGIHLASEIMVSDPELLNYTINETQAAAIVPENMPYEISSNIRRVPVLGQGLYRILVYAWQKESENACIETFVRFLSEKTSVQKEA